MSAPARSACSRCSASSKWLAITMYGASSCDLIRRVACRPPISGIARSINTTCGRNVSERSIASRPLPALPTICSQSILRKWRIAALMKPRGHRPAGR
ncbi:hypothetical protein VM57_09810 [Stenotrophomonas maltophilia]|uniref:Uncharacterized protein n=1 Tax=Stenotrophomonas maltophilia TaxID=40324 RepID=A0A0F5ZNB3_STEMA|nr:hypothetical protein VM57_09810 [Stenotrophomonas maltophilia]